MRSIEDQQKILELWEQGFKKKRIAIMTDIPRATVRDCIDRYGTVANLLESESTKQREWQSKFSDADYRKNYAYLLAVYLGDGCISMIRSTPRLRIVQDTKYPGLIQGFVDAISVIMPDNQVHVMQKSLTNCVEIGCSSNLWPSLFPQHGEGVKHMRKIELVDWQQAIVDEYPLEFWRGLYHTDGCRINPVVNGKVYSRYQFTNVSEDIHGLFCMACDALGISWTRYGKNVTIAKRKDIEFLDREVGPKT